MAIRILHTGDLHIGNFPGPEVNGENARFQDICKCLDALVEGAKESRPDIAVIAGDVFHQARVWSDRGLKEQQTAVKFLRELERICPVVVMRGTPNHDSEEQFKTLESTFYGDDSVHIITQPEVGTYHSYDGKKVQIACIPGFDRGYYRAKHPGLSKEEENEVFTKAVEDMIIGLKAQCDADCPTVLVSHYTITGCNMESGQTAFFSQFEPVVYPSTLAAADYNLVCFGHIHRPQQLDGCKNTFYCGAISALNFNDEGQERGYWLHDIYDCYGKVNSTFKKLPTREYLTIRLKDEAVAGINESGPEWLCKLPYLGNAEEIEGKIVRVLYDCTDEHNKAFNHAVLENWLYEAGKAFWVQEIAPQKITITVDRRSMDAGSTPEENLESYLAEKGMEPERIGEVVELARPIIAEATEKATTERRTGVFVPVEIEVKNYRNYREEHFSFEDIRFCTINGSNGVGKSSLFMDAMADALFEETREGELTGWICNDPDARSGAIKFTFRLGESLYRVTRTRQKSGKATLNIAEFVDGEWVDRSKEKLKDTQQEIINIIGVDSLTLKACALIMQDQYGLFLQADKEARMNILGSILGLGIYTGMETLAADRATETNRSIRSLADRAETITAGLPDRSELAAQIKETEERQRCLETQAQDKEKEIDSLKVTLNTQLEAASRVIRLNSKIATLTAQKSAKEASKTSQVGIITAADTILANEAEITAGVAVYKAMLEQEKELIKNTVLEAAEKEYIALDGQRAELKLLEERRGEMEASIKNAEEAAAKGREELAAVEKQLSDAETYSREYESFQQELQKQSLWLEKEKQLPVAREQKAAASSRVIELTTEIENVETELSEAREELAAEQAKTVGKDELQAQVEAAEQTVKTLREHAQTAAMQLGGLKNTEAEAEKKLAEAAELQKRMNELGGKAAGYEELKKAFSQDGIPHNIIRSIIPIFEATATNILGQMSGGKMSVEFVTEKTLKSNSKKEVTTLDIIINDSDTGRLPYMSRSGGERVKAALSVILALSEIKSSKAGIQLGFLFIDEPPFLDAPGVQAYCDALEAIQHRYSDLKVMAITHDPAMKSRFPQSVDVVKTQEGSKVIYE